jgi:CheY-like chemotaxis protein
LPNPREWVIDMKKPKILLVDNSRFFLEVNRCLLEDPRFELLLAYDGQLALHLIKTEHPDLIIMDVAIPRSDGGKVQAALNSDPVISLIPVIMIVDAENPADINDALSSCCFDYITKPLGKGSLIGLLRKYLPAVQRSMPRIPCNIPVVLQCDDTLALVPCDNISVEGMFIKSSLKIKKGSEVVVSFRLPGESRTKLQITAKGRVVWNNEKRSLHSKIPIGFGIKNDVIIGGKSNMHRREELMAFIEANKEKTF